VNEGVEGSGVGAEGPGVGAEVSSKVSTAGREADVMVIDDGEAPVTLQPARRLAATKPTARLLRRLGRGSWCQDAMSLMA
jgi:hypothetical protein